MKVRGCYEGWACWLKQGTGPQTYAPGQLWGCIGSWYSGAWHDSGANTYIAQVQTQENNHTWLTPSFEDSRQQYDCDRKYGCPN
jgi:hypothetical protein